MSTNDTSREDRLAAALRENLRRRKAQARAAKPDKSPAQKKEPTQAAKE